MAEAAAYDEAIYIPRVVGAVEPSRPRPPRQRPQQRGRAKTVAGAWHAE